jgi:preprotein translocase subunit SecG
MLTFLLVVYSVIVLALVAVILMQRSEGGGLASGGNPGGLMSARGAADFLTRTTAILGTIFIVFSIALAAIASMQNRSQTIDTSLAKRAPATQTAPAVPAAPAPGGNSSVPLAQ